MLSSIVAFVVATGVAQPPPPRDLPPPQTGTAVIKGRVVDAATGGAIARARVRLQGRLNQFPTTVTDSSGTFAFARLPAGPYTVVADRVGYVQERFPGGMRTLRSLSSTLTVRDGEVVDTVTLRMWRGGVITGRVVDAYGDPVEYANVTVTKVPPSGRVTGQTMGRFSASTNDLGEFRVPRLEPGNYIVMAAPRVLRTDDVGVEPQAVATYYPNVASAEQSQPISLKRGESIANLVVTMEEGLPAVVTVTVVDAGGQRLTSNVTVTVRANHGVGGVGASSFTNGLLTNGTFRFPLTPGNYELEARTTTVGGFNESRDGPVGLTRISVSGGTVNDVVIVLRERPTVTGQFVFQGSSPLPANQGNFRVDLSSDAFSNCSSTGFDLAPNWTFVLRGVAGTCRIRVSGGDRNWTLKSVMQGTTDLVDQPLTMEPGQTIRDLQVIFTDRRTQLTLEVMDETGRPTREYAAIVFSVDRRRWTEPFGRHVRTYVPPPMSLLSPNGAASTAAVPGVLPISASNAPQIVPGLPPGDYYAIAVEDVDAEFARDPDFLETIVPQATRVSVTEGASALATLRRIRLQR